MGELLVKDRLSEYQRIMDKLKIKDEDWQQRTLTELII